MPLNLAEQLRSEMVPYSVDAVVNTFVENIKGYAALNRHSSTCRIIKEYDFTNNRELDTMKSMKLAPKTPELPHPELVFHDCDTLAVVKDIIKAFEDMGFNNVQVGGTCGGVFFEPSEPWFNKDSTSTCDCGECSKQGDFAVMGIYVEY